MLSTEKHNTHLVVLGATTIAVSFLVSSGYWDIFDLLISAVMLATTIYYARENQDLINGSGLYVVWCSISIISTALAISTVAVYAGVSGNEFAATIDINNAKLLIKKPDENVNYFQVQSIWQLGIFVANFILWGVVLYKWRNALNEEAIEKPNQKINRTNDS